MHEDHKTYIPGVGFLVTSWDGAESHIFPINEGISEKESNWESFLQKTEAAFEGVDGAFDIEELNITWKAFSAGDSVEDTIAKVTDHAAQQVVEYFEELLR